MGGLVEDLFFCFVSGASTGWGVWGCWAWLTWWVTTNGPKWMAFLAAAPEGGIVSVPVPVPVPVPVGGVVSFCMELVAFNVSFCYFGVVGVGWFVGGM